MDYALIVPMIPRGAVSSPVALSLLLSSGCLYAELGGSSVSPPGDLSNRDGESSASVGVAAEIPYPRHPRGIRLALGAGGSCCADVTTDGNASALSTGPLVLRTDISVLSHRNLYLRATAMGELPLDPRDWADEPLGFLFAPTLTSGDEDTAFQFTFGARWTRLPGVTDRIGIQLRVSFEVDVPAALGSEN